MMRTVGWRKSRQSSPAHPLRRSSWRIPYSCALNFKKSHHGTELQEKPETKTKTKGITPNFNMDTAKEVRSLLGVISFFELCCHHIGAFKNKRLGIVTKNDVTDLEVVITALKSIYVEGRRSTSKVCVVKYLLKAYDKRKSAERDKEEPRKKSKSLSMPKVKEFIAACEIGWKCHLSSKPLQPMALLSQPLQPMVLLTGGNKNWQPNRDSVAPEKLGAWVTPTKPSFLFN